MAVVISNGEHRVILYRTKQDVLSTFTLANPASVIYIKSDYIQYHDDGTQFWSIRFVVDTDRFEFVDAVKSVCIIEEEMVKEVAVDKTDNSLANSIVESNQSTLLNRMAKMGQKIVPNNVLPLKESSSESEDVAFDSPPLQRKHLVSSKWKPDVPSRSVNNNHQLQYPPNKSSPVLSASTLISYNPVHAIGNDPEIVSLFTENRFQNTEIRMCLSKLESKIERVLDKVDLIRESNQSSSTKPKSDLEEDIIKLEEKLLDLKKENRQLRLGREADNRSDHDLLVEKQKNLQLEERIQSQKIEIEEFRNLVATKESELNQSKKLRQQSDDKLHSCTLELRQKNEELTKIQTESNLIVAELKSTIANLEEDKLKFEKKVQQLQSEPKSNGIDTSSVVKDIMNNMYQSITETVNERSEWSANDVLKIMRTVMKRATMNALSDESNS